MHAKRLVSCIPMSFGVDLAECGRRATAWRHGALSELEQRAEELGCAGRVEVEFLLARIKDLTCDLDQLSHDQESGARDIPWWADGEYDKSRAEERNEAGAALYRRREFGAALTAFTDAVRLCPDSAAYWSNRASAATAAGAASVAAESLHRLATVRPHCATTRAKLLKALLGMGATADARAALGDWAKSIPWDETGDRSELEREVRAREEGEASRRKADRAAATKGLRTALAREGMPEEDAAMLWESADGMLKAQPDRECARCMMVESLIMCRRYADALERCKTLLPGPDRDYLQAEALWRSGRVEEAAEVLAAHPEVPKCWSLAADLGYVAGVVREAEAAVEEQRWADAEDACWLLCSWDGLSGSKGRDGSPAVCGQGASGLFARVTCALATSLRQQRRVQEALRAVEDAWRLEPWDLALARHRGACLREMGRYEEALEHLQAASVIGADEEIEAMVAELGEWWRQSLEWKMRSRVLGTRRSRRGPARSGHGGARRARQRRRGVDGDERVAVQDAGHARVSDGPGHPQGLPRAQLGAPSRQDAGEDRAGAAGVARDLPADPGGIRGTLGAGQACKIRLGAHLACLKFSDSETGVSGRQGGRR